jgi:hypothetical protein
MEAIGMERRSIEKKWAPTFGLPTLPIAPKPIGKVGACGFGIRVRNGGGSAAPESLPPKSEIGDGR